MILRFVDSNIFIYYLAADPKYGRRAREIIGGIEKGETSAVSTLTLAQVCAYLRRRKRTGAILKFLVFVRGLANLSKIDTLYSDFNEAEEMQSKQHLDWKLWDDVVIAAQMARSGVREIYSNDADFDKIPKVTRLF